MDAREKPSVFRHRLKIAILSDLAPPYMGGGESYVVHLGRQLVSEGHEIHWVTSRLPETEAHETLEGISIHRVPILFSGRFLFPGRQTFALTTVFQNLSFLADVDVVQANTLVAGYSGWRIAEKYGKPSLLFCFELFGNLWRSIGQNAFERSIYPRIEKRIARSPYSWYACPSEYSKSTLVSAGAPKEKISVIPLGIDHNLYNPQADGTGLRRKLKAEGFKLFGYMGRLRVRRTGQSKNLRMLLQAARLVVKTIENSRLVLAGQGYDELRPFIAEMGLERMVIYAGALPNELTPQFLRMCDTVVCPALSDGFCFLLAEASACGVPVVATKAGSHIDRIIHGRTGLLTETNAEALAASLIAILSDEDRAAGLGREGRRYSERYSWGFTAKKHIGVYKALVSGNRNPR